MEFTRCLRCMKETTGYPCPHCGYVPGEGRPKDYVLRPGTILNGKYVVGAILGQGGFGITYIGWDLALDCKVAIKEYYPSGQVVRDNSTGSVLHWLSTPQSETARDMGKEMFLKEARKMTRVRDIPQVVHVHDLFQENDTAYIIMDFVEGQTLKAHLSKPLTWEDARKIFLPAIRAMEQVHQAGLIHRDLSPDNIMLLPNGDVRILDLGAAKDLNVNSGASSMQVAKGGFSPLEQYTQRGGSGPWSDVYAMAATMYYSLTGVLPPPVMDRMEDDQLRWDLEPLKALPKPVLEALKKAMALLAKDRTQTMGEFLSQLEKATPGPAPDPIPRKALLAAIAAVLVVALLAGWVLTPKQDSPAQEPETLAQLADTFATEETAPTTDETEGPTDQTEAAMVPETENTASPTTAEGILMEYAGIYELNPDLVGWIKIEGTEIDYPVLQTPDRPDYYLHRAFDGSTDQNGAIYVQEDCDVNLPSDNVTIFGNNMSNGKMFAALHKYESKEFWKENGFVVFDTLKERHVYQIFAVFKTLANVGEGFSYHQFVDAADEAEFDDFVATCKKLSKESYNYDTGITPVYGDKLICLSTFEYSLGDNGRLVVAAVRIS